MLATRLLRIIPVCLLMLVTSPFASGAAERLSPSLQSVADTPNGAAVKVWVYFADHGEAGAGDLRALLARVDLDERARERRALRSNAAPADVHDLPVHRAYVDALRGTGARVRHESRYLNAVSAWVTPEQLRVIARLQGVARIVRVRRGTRPVPDSPPLPAIDIPRAPATTDAIDYGVSEFQHRQINTKPLHAAGYTGQGVRVAVLDTGFFLFHNGLLHMNVIAEWDFINDDAITRDQSNDTPGQMGHGTASLGILAVKMPGKAMGVCWEAEYILAKTERLIDEIEAEEDDFIAALEWADGHGADIVSSSLGYYLWYEYDDLDGDTAAITRAVDIAASRGILVVTAMGNFGDFPWPTILAPADADSAVAVGAVDSLGVAMEYSSHGPTADGRIKPDVMAMGQIVATASWQNPLGIGVGTGTSAATPLVAGACALILQQHPDWSPIDVRNALRATASRSDAPDTEYGWGIVDAYAAASYAATITVTVDARPGSCDNPFNPKSRGVVPVLLCGTDGFDVAAVDVASLQLAGAPALRARVADMGGGDCDSQAPDGYDDLLLTFDTAAIAASMPAAAKHASATLALTGHLHDGTAITGETTVRIVGSQDGPVRADDAAPTVTTGLVNAVPNPFNPVTRITYRVARSTTVELAVYDVAGRHVATLVDGVRPAGEHSVTWNATGATSGVYFYRLCAGGIEETRKLVLLK